MGGRNKIVETLRLVSKGEDLPSLPRRSAVHAESGGSGVVGNPNIKFRKANTESRERKKEGWKSRDCSTALLLPTTPKMESGSVASGISSPRPLPSQSRRQGEEIPASFPPAYFLQHHGDPHPNPFYHHEEEKSIVSNAQASGYSSVSSLTSDTFGLPPPAEIPSFLNKKNGYQQTKKHNHHLEPPPRFPSSMPDMLVTRHPRAPPSLMKESSRPTLAPRVSSTVSTTKPSTRATTTTTTTTTSDDAGLPLSSLSYSMRPQGAPPPPYPSSSRRSPNHPPFNPSFSPYPLSGDFQPAISPSLRARSPPPPPPSAVFFVEEESSSHDRHPHQQHSHVAVFAPIRSNSSSRLSSRLDPALQVVAVRPLPRPEDLVPTLYDYATDVEDEDEEDHVVEPKKTSAGKKVVAAVEQQQQQQQQQEQELEQDFAWEGCSDFFSSSKNGAALSVSTCGWNSTKTQCSLIPTCTITINDGGDAKNISSREAYIEEEQEQGGKEDPSNAIQKNKKSDEEELIVAVPRAAASPSPPPLPRGDSSSLLPATFLISLSTPPSLSRSSSSSSATFLVSLLAPPPSLTRSSSWSSATPTPRSFSPSFSRSHSLPLSRQSSLGNSATSACERSSVKTPGGFEYTMSRSVNSSSLGAFSFGSLLSQSEESSESDEKAMATRLREKEQEEEEEELRERVVVVQAWWRARRTARAYGDLKRAALAVSDAALGVWRGLC